MPRSRHNRREFINVTSAALAALAGAPELAASAQSAPAATQTTGTVGPDPDLLLLLKDIVIVRTVVGGKVSHQA
jgi:hypothetical protein